MESIEKRIAALTDYLVEQRRYFHSHPELSCKEYNTSRRIKEELDKMGIPYETAGETSVVATIKGALPGKTVAVRGDIDALPILEMTGVPFASKTDGVMHACGHDCHITFALGCARFFGEMRDELKGTVKVVFQEGEEVGAGARKILAAGLLDDVDNIAGLHVTPEIDLGKFGTGYGPRMASGGGVVIKIIGKAGHSSTPYKAVNALSVAGQVVSAINRVAAYDFDPFDQVVLVPTIAHAGTKVNIIPGEAEITYNYRLLDMKYAPIIAEKAMRAAQRTAEACGATAEVTVQSFGMVSLSNEKESTDRAIKVMKEQFGDDAAQITRPVMGGEDFAAYLQKIPGTFAFIGAARDGNYQNLHTDKSLPDEDVLALGTQFLVAYALDYLNEEE